MTISKMVTIYRHPLLTVVAADSKDADSSLVGLEAGSRRIRCGGLCRQHLPHFGRTGTRA